jgi:hypothetical protein
MTLPASLATRAFLCMLSYPPGRLKRVVGPDLGVEGYGVYDQPFGVALWMQTPNR